MRDPISSGIGSLLSVAVAVTTGSAAAASLSAAGADIVLETLLKAPKHLLRGSGAR